MSVEELKDLRSYKILTVVFIITSFAFMGLHAGEKGEFMFWTWETEPESPSYESGKYAMFMELYPSPQSVNEAVESGHLDYTKIPQGLIELLEYEIDE